MHWGNAWYSPPASDSCRELPASSHISFESASEEEPQHGSYIRASRNQAPAPLTKPSQPEPAHQLSQLSLSQRHQPVYFSQNQSPRLMQARQTAKSGCQGAYLRAVGDSQLTR
ncbi:unnamed protein product [Effrenium voratum]|nr:unnamed protein product [Effrenium voratum]